jgi:STAM-binding protein
VFPLNSALDSWQTACIMTSELVPGFPNQNSTANGLCAVTTGWADCARDPEACNVTQIGTMNAFISDFTAAMKAAPTYTRPGNGAFIHSCHTHCEAQGSAFFTISVGGVTMQQAVGSWWRSNGTDPAAVHTHEPCHYKSSLPYKCNPTC